MCWIHSVLPMRPSLYLLWTSLMLTVHFDRLVNNPKYVSCILTWYHTACTYVSSYWYRTISSRELLRLTIATTSEIATGRRSSWPSLPCYHPLFSPRSIGSRARICAIGNNKNICSQHTIGGDFLFYLNIKSWGWQVERLWDYNQEKGLPYMKMDWN